MDFRGEQMRATEHAPLWSILMLTNPSYDPRDIERIKARMASMHGIWAHMKEAEGPERCHAYRDHMLSQLADSKVPDGVKLIDLKLDAGLAHSILKGEYVKRNGDATILEEVDRVREQAEAAVWHGRGILSYFNWMSAAMVFLAWPMTVAGQRQLDQAVVKWEETKAQGSLLRNVANFFISKPARPGLAMLCCGVFLALASGVVAVRRVDTVSQAHFILGPDICTELFAENTTQD